MSTNLEEFKDLVMGIDDIEVIDIARELLEDIIKIENMKEKIKALEDSLSEGGRAAFWFFAMGLDREEIDLATNIVLGRKRVIQSLDKKITEKRIKSKAEPSDNELFQI